MQSDAPEKNPIERRKQDHLSAFRHHLAPQHTTTTWLECVQLIHNALPELNLDELDISSTYAGQRFRAPVFITGMTGGTRDAGRINRDLAMLAERLGIGFGLGSARALLENPTLLPTYRVRESAPRVFLASNLGGQQLLHFEHARIVEHLQQLEANALCIHINPAQELLQPEGDRDFRGILKAIERLVAQSPVPVIVKECGSGISRKVAERLKNAGVRQIDVAGSGGTSWTGLELLRHGQRTTAEGSPLWNWGIPTAASLVSLQGCEMQVMASGGIRNGLDAARAIALKADLVGVAAPIMQAYLQQGIQAVETWLTGLIEDLRRIMLLVGARTVPDLQQADRVLWEPLRTWSSSRSG